MDITSTEKIVVGTREFESIQSLWKSTFPVGLGKELIGVWRGQKTIEQLLLP